MPARYTSTRTIRGAGICALALVLVSLPATPATAQDRSLIPGEVKVVGGGTSATISWLGVGTEGVTYRVLRQGDADRAPIDITRPVSVTSAVDTRVGAGMTYSYQVMAVFRDGTTTSSDPVKYTAPSAPAPTPPPLLVVTQPALQTATAVPLFATAVTGITVTGTTASAVVSWAPAGMATSYAVTRTQPGGIASQPVTGITGTSWNDPGPAGIGFTKAGVYAYDVTASLSNGTTVTGQTTWTRPSPTCAAPPPAQPMLTILAPLPATVIGPYPGVAGFSWQASGSAVIAHRMDRSVQGSGIWTPAGTSCDGAITLSYAYYGYIDRTAGTVAPNTAYLYRLTAIAANGETGERILNWTSPNAPVLHWLSAVVSGSSVTLKFRYEAPATNAPQTPSERYHVTSDYGLDQVVSSGTFCASLAGCTLVVNGVPSGSHVFTVTAGWGNSRTNPIVTMSANNTVVIP